MDVSGVLSGSADMQRLQTLAEDRRRQVAEILLANPKVTNSQLAQMFNTIPRTIQKDRSILSKRGIKVSGWDFELQNKQPINDDELTDEEKTVLDEMYENGVILSIRTIRQKLCCQRDQAIKKRDAYYKTNQDAFIRYMEKYGSYIDHETYEDEPSEYATPPSWYVEECRRMDVPGVKLSPQCFERYLELFKQRHRMRCNNF